MDEYLIDTNILFDMMNSDAVDFQRVWAARRARKAVLHLPVVALGEAGLGYCLQGIDRDAARKGIETFLRGNGILIQDMTKHTADTYGDLKARLVRQYQPNKMKWPEKWSHPVTGAELSIDECDLWIIAQAIERNLVLVTADRMERLREVIKELRVENWRVASGL